MGRSKWKETSGNSYDFYKEYEWNESKTTVKEPTIYDLLEMMDKLIEQHPRNINKILENLSEEDIQKFLRAKKLSKIKGKVK